MPTTTVTARRRAIDRFRRQRGRANKHGATRTAEIYAWAADRLDTWLTVIQDERGFDRLDRDTLEDFLDAFARGKDGFSEHADSYTNQIYRSLCSFYDWIADEYELPASPMGKVTPRSAGEQRTENKVLSSDQLADVLDTVAHNRRDFASLRDHAMLRLLLTGVRRAELVELTVDDVDLDRQQFTVHGKGDHAGTRTRTLAFGDKTLLALDRYLEARERHPLAARRELWLGKRGVLTGRGLHTIVKKRGEQAGIAGLHPHQFRHTAADRWLADGGSEGDLMENHGWKTREMARYYARENAAKRARTAWRARGLDEI